MSDNRTFVSYSRSDSEFAVKLASDLRTAGAEVWLDQLDIEAGARWDTAIEQALQRSARILVVLSPKSVASQNVLDEVSFALDEGKTVVPVLVEACAIPMRLRRLQHVDFTRDYAAALARLLGTLGVARPAAPTAAPPPSAARPIETPPPPIEAPPSPEPFSYTSATPASGPNRTLLIGAGAAALVVLVVVISLSMRDDPETGPPLDSSATTATPADTGSAEATPPQAAPAPAAAPPQANTSETTSPPEGTASKAVRMASGGTPLEAVNQPRMAPAGQTGGGGFGSMLGPLRRGDTASGADMPAFLALMRELGDRTSLSAADLARLGDAQFKACPFSADETPCVKQTDASVTSLLQTVCKRQASPDVSSCARDYEFKILDSQREKVGEMLKTIKPG